jgi:hypothetical protein
MNDISRRTDSILSIRTNLIEIVAVAVVVGIGVNLLAAGIVAHFGWSSAMTSWLGIILVLGGYGYLGWRAIPRINKKLVFEGVFVVTRRNNRVNLDLWYTAPPTKGGDNHGKFTVHRSPDPPDGGGGFDESHPERVSAVDPAF